MKRSPHVERVSNVRISCVSDDDFLRLRKAAVAASARAYCPYSNFPVGAAVLTETGELTTGCNVENASFGLTMCAERNAIFQAVTKGESKLRAILVYTPSDNPSPPCGACRQVIHEFGPDTIVYSTCDGPDISCDQLSALLPQAFGRRSLK